MLKSRKRMRARNNLICGTCTLDVAINFNFEGTDIIRGRGWMKVEKVAVIGAGIMGSGIALSCALGGYRVCVRDVSEEIIEQALRKMNFAAKTLVAGKMLSKKKRNFSLKHVKGTLDIAEAVRDADLVIEAVPEKLDLKKRVLKELEELSSTRTIFASNTSTFLITEMAKAMKRPEKMIGTHWMNPPYLLPLVEVVLGAKTSSETVNTVKLFLTSLGKKPVLCKDTPGFIVNRMQSALLVEAISLVEQEIATMEDIDMVWTQHLGLRYCHIGPFEAMDIFGLDTELSQYSYLYEMLGEAKFQPPDLLKRKVKNGELGLKTGKGFYDYFGKNIESITKQKDKKFIELMRLLNRAPEPHSTS
jgi:3-hydroxybutyryl-CoA dehydrogenase